MHFDDKVCWPLIAAFEIITGDVTAWIWESQRSTLWAKHKMTFEEYYLLV